MLLAKAISSAKQRWTACCYASRRTPLRDLASVQLVGCTEVTREHLAGCTYTGGGRGDRFVSRY